MRDENKDLNPVNTPHLKTRGEAWMAWKAYHLSKRKKRKDKSVKTLFGQVFDNALGDLYQFTAIKPFSGTVSGVCLDGFPKTIPLVVTTRTRDPKAKARDLGEKYFFEAGFVIKEEHNELHCTQKWLYDIEQRYRRLIDPYSCFTRAPYYSWKTFQLLIHCPVLGELDYVVYHADLWEEYTVTEWRSDGVVETKVPRYHPDHSDNYNTLRGFELHGVFSRSFEGLLKGLIHRGIIKPEEEPNGTEQS